ncbi:TonB-dependent receptor [Draconibacterium sp. IB214405]|uniref:TonB-dependent receptor plug domain-containing protein n=1 Tax=Draconibacterium sp. IB214405 TaxID=3097352 RepID=UPI002A0E8D19|nr:TonB-dependent receptor [Draconibacterium sp. IB214405]MDX8337677.1 TonB-dependent receptor [Draconibacterium sp. IB214405]
MRLFILSFIIILFTHGIANAQMHFATNDTIKINEVVVTGTQVQVNRNNVPMAVSVVNRTQIEESDESAILPILNGRVPGLFVTERGITGFGVAAGSAGQISIRGIGGSPTTGVLMLIDGHPQFMGIMGHPLPDSYVASDVERVEVIRGPASILYGSNAMGGVINIITKKQDVDGWNGNARISYGSYNTQKYMGSVGFKKDKFSVFISGNHDQTDGHRPNSDFKITNGYLKLGYRISDHFDASADFSVAAFDASDPGPDTLNASPGETIDILRGYGSFSLRNNFEKASGAMKFFYNFGEHEITDGFHSNDHNYGLNLYETFQLFEGNNLTAGIDLMNYGGKAENTFAMGGKGLTFADTTVTEIGTYLFSQQSFGDKLIINAGLRYHHHSQYGSVWIPSVGFANSFSPSTTWKGTISKGFRSPTMRELFMWGPNPNLDPESIWNYETGLIQVFFEGGMQVELTAFLVKGDNLIVNTGQPNGYQNTGEVSNNGIEFSLDATPTKDLTLNATYSYTNMKNPVYATPEHHLFLNASYRLKKLLLVANVQHISGLDNDPTAVTNLESYTLVNAKASYNLTRNVKLYVSGENLLSTDYAVNRYYTMPEATMFGGLSLMF